MNKFTPLEGDCYR